MIHSALLFEGKAGRLSGTLLQLTRSARLAEPNGKSRLHNGHGRAVVVSPQGKRAGERHVAGGALELASELRAVPPRVSDGYRGCLISRLRRATVAEIQEARKARRAELRCCRSRDAM